MERNMEEQQEQFSLSLQQAARLRDGAQTCFAAALQAGVITPPKVRRLVQKAALQDGEALASCG